MSDSDKERTIGGCAPWVVAGMLISSLWSISTQLRHINETLVMANCLTEAAHGITCPEAKRK